MQSNGVNQAVVRTCRGSATLENDSLSPTNAASKGIDLGLLDKSSVKMVEVDLISNKISLVKLRVVTLLVSNSSFSISKSSFLFSSHALQASLSHEKELLVLLVENKLKGLKVAVLVSREVVRVVSDFKGAYVLEGFVDSHLLADGINDEIIAALSLEDLNRNAGCSPDEGDFEDHMPSRVE